MEYLSGKNIKLYLLIAAVIGLLDHLTGYSSKVLGISHVWYMVVIAIFAFLNYTYKE